VADLTVSDTFAGLGLPFAIGNCRLEAAAAEPIISVSPFSGQVDTVERALRGIGLGFPEPGQVLAAGAVRAVWAGRATVFLMGGAPPDCLADHAALTDQGDGWAGLRLSGTDAEAILARLVAQDVRHAAFPPESAARSQLNHMPCLILRVTETVFEIYVFRSMAGSAVHELSEAMRNVAARAALR